MCDTEENTVNTIQEGTANLRYMCCTMESGKQIKCIYTTSGRINENLTVFNHWNELLELNCLQSQTRQLMAKHIPSVEMLVSSRCTCGICGRSATSLKPYLKLQINLIAKIKLPWGANQPKTQENISAMVVERHGARDWPLLLELTCGTPIVW